MKQITLAGGATCMVDDEDFEMLSKFKWYANKRAKGHGGYAARKAPRPQRGIILMHRVITNCPDGLHVDHVNGCGLDNRRLNLRVCTVSQNQANQRLGRANKIGLKGVSLEAGQKNYRAQIQHKGRRIFIGYFETAQQAHEAYIAKAKELFGEFARAS